MLVIFARRHPLEKSWFKFQNFEQSLYDLTGHSVSSRPVVLRTILFLIQD